MEAGIGKGKGECVYTAASANRASHIADWASIEGADELVYASHKNLVIARNIGVSVLADTSLIIKF